MIFHTGVTQSHIGDITMRILSGKCPTPRLVIDHLYGPFPVRPKPFGF